MHDVTTHTIAEIVTFDELTQVIPIANVRPTEPRWHDCYPLRVLEHALVDRRLLQSRPDVGRDQFLLRGAPYLGNATHSSVQVRVMK